MYYIVETDKSFDQASINLESAVIRNGFGVLHIHDLGAALRSKGIAFAEECKIFEVCNPGQAAKVLSTDMRLNMPCRVVFRYLPRRAKRKSVLLNQCKCFRRYLRMQRWFKLPKRLSKRPFRWLMTLAWMQKVEHQK